MRYTFLFTILALTTFSALSADYDLQGWLQFRKNRKEQAGKDFVIKTEVDRFRNLDLDGNGILKQEERIRALEMEKQDKK
jgi:hypothetical protein